jgi:hypothetical protein
MLSDRPALSYEDSMTRARLLRDEQLEHDERVEVREDRLTRHSDLPYTLAAPAGARSTHARAALDGRSRDAPPSSRDAVPGAGFPRPVLGAAPFFEEAA